MKGFEGEKMGTQKFVIGHKIDLSFHDWKITNKFDDKSHKDCNIRSQTGTQKANKARFDCNSIRLNLDE